MDRTEAKERVKQQLESYLTGKGIDTRRNFSCLNPNHPGDKNPSMSFDRRRNKAHCFSCGADYDTFDLIGIDYGLTDPSSIFLKAYEVFGLEADRNPAKSERTKKPEPAPASGKEDLGEYIARCAERLPKGENYFTQRGLTQGTIERFRLGYDPSLPLTGWQAAIIPTSRTSCTARNLNSKGKEDRIRKRGGSPIFNAEALTGPGPVFIVEGEMDALSIIEAGADAVALGSVANADQLVRLLKANPPEGRLILSLDNDQAGLEASKRLTEAFIREGISFLQENVSGSHKDANEALMANREGFLARVSELVATEARAEQDEQEAIRAEYLNTSAASHVKAFRDGVKASADTPCVPTGFGPLDNVLDGGLYEGLYIIGAISSLGKTSFVLQVVDQMAQNHQDVLIFSLEMARTELMAKSISRGTFLLAPPSQRNLAKTARGITAGKRYESYNKPELDLIEQATDGYALYADCIYISEGVGDIGVDQVRQTVEKHISITGKKPVVVIDYLQLLAPHDPRATDKQNTDKAVMELKRITRDFKIPVIAISSFNRQNYSTEVSMESFKESGAIEYSSDVLMGIQAKGAGTKNFDVNTAKAKDPREIEVRILKNRNGATGGIIELEYYPRFNYFHEPKRRY